MKMDSDTDMTTFARPTISLNPPPPLEFRFSKEHMPFVQRVHESNSNGGSSRRRSPLSHEIRLAKIPRATGIAVSSLARMKIKHRRAFARQIRINLMQPHLGNKNYNNNNTTSNFKLLQGQIEDLRDMFENMWVSSPRIHGWKIASKTSKCGPKRLRGATNARPNHRLAQARHNHRSRPSLTRRELLASFVRATSRRFQGSVMPKM
ncbi:hypothetical protein BGZ52_002226 [Haplosporangium bisporale]|nr:hypothetical protein BGZ52_002226 [Haplosporangium bisporale]